MDQRIEKIKAAADYIKSRVKDAAPLLGIVLGSGLGKLGEQIENPTIIPYKEIPGLPVSTAIGHKGNLIFGTLEGKPVVAMQGRFHFYEGYSMEQVTMCIRIMSLLGVKNLFVSNAAGGCNPNYHVGDLIIIKDHINLLPNPLVGPNMAEFGERFPDMTCAYDTELIEKATLIGKDMGIQLEQGIYLASTGPTYETPAEVRYFRTIGADLLGMSTIPEVIVARHCGMRVFGVSVVTNLSNTTNVAKDLNDSQDVVIQADRAADTMTELFKRLIASL